MGIAHNAIDQIKIIHTNGTDKVNGWGEIVINEKMNGEINIQFDRNYHRRIIDVSESVDGQLIIAISKPVELES